MLNLLLEKRIEKLLNYGAILDSKGFLTNLNQLDEWKTTVYFQFTFYQSLIVLKGILNATFYNLI